MATNRILVVDGDAAAREKLAQALEIAGYEVIRAADRQDAEGWCGGLGFDLMVLSLNLPEGESTDLLRGINLGQPSLPTVFLKKSKVQKLPHTGAASASVLVAGCFNQKKTLNAVQILLAKSA